MVGATGATKKRKKSRRLWLGKKRRSNWVCGGACACNFLWRRAVSRNRPAFWRHATGPSRSFCPLTFCHWSPLFCALFRRHFSCRHGDREASILFLFCFVFHIAARVTCVRVGVLPVAKGTALPFFSYFLFLVAIEGRPWAVSSRIEPKGTREIGREKRLVRARTRDRSAATKKPALAGKKQTRLAAMP